VADNILLNAGSGGSTLATDDLGGSPAVHIQRVKPAFGADGSATDVAAATPLPVDPTPCGPLKRAKISCATSGVNTLVAGVVSKKLRLISLALFSASGTAVSLYFHEEDGAATGLLGDSDGKVTLDLDGGSGPSGFVLNHNPSGWIETPTAGKGLQLNLSAAVRVCGCLTYVEV
jgi:hypothetical protein